MLEGRKPSWSPDGKHIVFEGPVAGAPGLFAMRADGGGLRRLTENASDACPSWSAGGDTVVFTRRPPEASPGMNKDVYSIDVNGGVPKRLTAFLGRATCPVWSPRGHQIAFGFFSQGPPATWKIYVTDVNGGNARQIVTSGGPEPDWSPDGTKIAYVAPGSPSASMFVANADGSGIAEVPNTQGRPGSTYPSDVAWSPDGSRLVYAFHIVDGHLGSSELYTIRVDGSEKTRVAQFVSGSANVSWQPLLESQRPPTRPPRVDTVPPNTRIAGPTRTTRRRAATFWFGSTEAGSTFECKLDRGRWTVCRSPKTYRRLSRGWHAFRVRARDAAGNVDRTPGVRIWRVR